MGAQAAAAADKTLLLCKGTVDFPDSTQRINGTVDVWWVFDILPARGMLLIIPYLLMQHKVCAPCLSLRSSARHRAVSCKKGLLTQQLPSPTQLMNGYIQRSRDPTSSSCGQAGVQLYT